VDQLAAGFVLSVLYAVEALCFLALAALATNFALAAVLGFALIDGTLALTCRGITRGAIAATLGTESSLRAGNALINVAFSTATILGAILAGVLVAEAGVRLALGLDAASFALVAALMLTCRGLPAAADRRERVRSRLAEGIRFVRRDPLLRALLSVQALALVLFTLIVPIEVIYAKETLGAGDAGFGALMGAWGSGMVVGPRLR
jgi:MFS family permease